MSEFRMVDPVERKRWGLSIAATEEMLAYPDASRGIAREAHREIQHATPVVKLRDDSVRLEGRRFDQATMFHKLDFEWVPEPAHGCEFKGGEAHGKVFAIPRETDGKPPKHYFVHVQPPIFAFEHVKADTPVAASSKAVYLRAGINPLTDRWVYEFDSISYPEGIDPRVTWLYFGGENAAREWERRNHLKPRSVVSVTNPYRLHGSHQRIVPVPHSGPIPPNLYQDASRAEQIMHRLNYVNGYEKDPEAWLRG